MVQKVAEELRLQKTGHWLQDDLDKLHNCSKRWLLRFNEEILVFIKLKYTTSLTHKCMMMINDVIMGLFEVVIPWMAFKVSANNLNFFRVGSGEVMLLLCYVNFNLICSHMSITFAISTSNNVISNTIYAWTRWCTYFGLIFTKIFAKLSFFSPKSVFTVSWFSLSSDNFKDVVLYFVLLLSWVDH